MKDGMKEDMREDEWELDLFSTFLSRKLSYHKMEGKRRYCKWRRSPRNVTRAKTLIQFFNKEV